MISLGQILTPRDDGVADTAYFRQLFAAYSHLDRLSEIAPMVRAFVLHHPQNQQTLHALRSTLDTLLSTRVEMQDWPHVIPVGLALAALDRVAADTTYVRPLLTAYDRLGQPQEAQQIIPALSRRHSRDLRLWRAAFVAEADLWNWPSVISLGSTLIAAADSTTADTTFIRTLFTAYARAGQPRQAAVTARILLRERPRSIPALQAAFATSSEIEDWPYVITVGQALAQVLPSVVTDRSYRLMMLTAYDALHWPRPAATLLAQAVAQTPEDPLAWLEYATELRLAGQQQPARVALGRGFPLASTDSSFRDVTLWLCYARELRLVGQVQEALDAIQRAIVSDHDDADIRAEQQRIIALMQRRQPRG